VIVLAAILAAVVSFSALLAVALGRAAAYADRDMEIDRERERVSSERRARLTVVRGGYAGCSRAQSTIACEPSTTVPSSSTSAGTKRFPVSS
jgi:hypothetical protein